MLNQVRTLLGQQAAAGYGPEFPGEEPIAAAFTPFPLVGLAREAHAAFFGRASDRVARNFLLRRYLTLLHRLPECQVALASFDSRVSYQDRYGDLAFHQGADHLLERQELTPLGSTPPGKAELVGPVLYDVENGRCLWEYTVTVTSPVLALRTERTPLPGSEGRRRNASYPLGEAFGQRSGPVPLGPVQGPGGRGPGLLLEPTGGLSWDAILSTAPRRSIEAVMGPLETLLERDGDRAEAFFAPLEGRQPGWLALWNQDPRTLLRLSGALLAFCAFQEAQAPGFDQEEASDG